MIFTANSGTTQGTEALSLEMKGESLGRGGLI